MSTWIKPIWMLRIVNRIAKYYIQFHKTEKNNCDHQIITSHASVITERSENDHNVLTGPYLFMHEWSKFLTLCKSKTIDLVSICTKLSVHNLFDLVIICSCNFIQFARVSKMQGGCIILHATVRSTIIVKVVVGYTNNAHLIGR